MISFEKVTKRYGARTAVDALSLTIPKGEFFAFLGPNGAGKTTTLKMAAGLLSPSEGRVLIGGVDMAKEPIQAKRLMAYVPDQPFLYDKLTGREFLKFVTGLYRVEPEHGRREMERLIDVFEMRDWIDELTEAYSHGMKQRVALSATLLHSPEVILLDEPLVGLDPQTGRLVKGILREQATRGTTIFMSTHVLSVAEQTADRIGILNRGKIVALGTMEELRARAGRRSAGAQGAEEDATENLEDIFFRILEEKPASPQAAL